MDNQIRVRFAPSPTGHLHVGGARTALFNWLYARKVGGAFVLRIEDTDAARSTEESYAAIIDGMQWLGLDWDEGPGTDGPYGPYVQSARQVLYHTEAKRLIDEGLAYRCFCSSDDLELMRKDAMEQGLSPSYDGRCRNLPQDEVELRLSNNMPRVVRFKMSREGETKLFDIIRGEIVFNNAELDDFILIKSDGKPAYNFAATVDDAKMQISHVIRGDDHISNTPKQIHLYKALGYKLPKFAHLPMILGNDRQRLSKRHGASSVQEFREQGYLPDAMVNYLALLGWSLDGNTEFFTRENLIKKFSLKRVSKNPAGFDLDKLNHVDGEHFKNLDTIERVALVFDRLVEDKVFPADFEVEEWASAEMKNGNGLSKIDASRRSRYASELPRLAIILKVMGNRLKNLKDVARILAYFYKDEYPTNPQAFERHLSDPQAAERLRQMAATLEALKTFERTEIERGVRELAESLGVGAGELIHPCRVALTGDSVSPDFFSVVHLLGRQKSVQRLEHAANQVAGAASR